MSSHSEIDEAIKTEKLYNSYKIIGYAESYDKKPGVNVKCIYCNKQMRVRYSNLKNGYTKPCECLTGSVRKEKRNYLDYIGIEYQGWKVINIEKNGNNYKTGDITIQCKACGNTVKQKTYNTIKRIEENRPILECKVCKQIVKNTEQTENDVCNDKEARDKYIGYTYNNDTIIDIKGNANNSTSIAIIKCKLCNREREVEIGRFLRNDDRRIPRCECVASGYNEYSKYIGANVFGDIIIDFKYKKNGTGYDKCFIVKCDNCGEVREIYNVSSVESNSKLSDKPRNFGYKLCNCRSGTRSQNQLDRYSKYIGKTIEGTRLTVLDIHLKTDENKKSKVMAKTLCACGNEQIQWLPAILGGHTASCGCKLKEAMARNSRYYSREFIGKTYGDLEVIDIKQTDTGGILWNCKCLLCDKDEWINPKLVVERKWHISCGCKIQSAFERNNKHTHLDMIGQDLGGGKIIDIYRTEGGVTRWKMICNFCEKEYIAIAANVAAGHTKSCGCINKSLGEKLVAKALTELDITFKEQVSPNGVKSVMGGPLFFDFVIKLPNGDIGVIEYDGEQHYDIDRMTFGGKKYQSEAEDRFYRLQENDKIKDEYCIKFGYKLLRLRDLYYNNNYEAIKNKIVQFFELK